MGKKGKINGERCSASQEREKGGQWRCSFCLFLARTRTVNHVVDPAARLLHANVAPFSLRHEVVVGHEAGNLVGQNDMAVGRCKQKGE